MGSSNLNDGRSSKVVRVVIIALILDLLAFTIPLPLFPRLIDSFVKQESHTGLTPDNSLLWITLNSVKQIRTFLLSHSNLDKVLSPDTQARWDLTILGGLLGSLFSFCQFLVSPRLGKLSDKLGRRPVLLASMAGNLVSAVLWLFASNFGLYALSRLVGGLSEGNVQLSIAAISDVTRPEARSKSLALVGIAFSLAFTIGPSLGAYFASKTLGLGSELSLLGYTAKLNSYAVPAGVTVALLSVETIYLALRLPETRWDRIDENDEPEVGVKRRTVLERRDRLGQLQSLHCAFLFFFSGAEFTLTFLTFSLFDYSNAQNGALLGFIGILSSLLQGGYTRKKAALPNGPSTLVLSGMRTCAISLAILASLPFLSYSPTSPSSPAFLALYAAAAGLAFVSATVVNSLNALASLETGAGIDKGAALGSFRSWGQLGRALGPVACTAVYFCFGPEWAYGVAAAGSAVVAGCMASLIRNTQEEVDRRQKKEL